MPPDFIVLAALELAAPALAWGALAAALPILIHLVLRQRARHQVFPAVQFLLPRLALANRAQRLKHLLLLALRVTAVVMVVAILTRLSYVPKPGNAAAGLISSPAGPVSAVIAIDDSASTSYRFGGRTRAERALQWARELLADGARFPDGSQFAVLSGSSNAEEIVWAQTPRAAERTLHNVRSAQHNRGVSRLLETACRLMVTARHSRREVYLFNDLTERSWAGSLPRDLSGLTALYVCDVGQPENASAALDWPAAPERVLPAGRTTRLKVRVRSGDLPVEPVIELRVGGQVRGRTKLEALAANSSAEADVELPPLEPGVHGLQLDLEPPDAFACDNRRFLQVEVGAGARVALISGPDREVAALTGAMIAPPALPPSERAFELEEITPASLPDAKLEEIAAVILADCGPLSAAGWASLAHYLGSGGAVLMLPGPNSTGDEGGADLLPAAIQAAAECEAPMYLAAPDLTHPYLAPFADPSVDSLSSRAIYRRLLLKAPRADSRVLCTFSDGAPALLERSVGRGRAILFAFSPARDWSQFGTQAAPTIVLLHTILESLAPKPSGIESWAAGQPIARPAATGASSVLVKGPPDGRGRELPVEGGSVRLPTEEAGLYELVQTGRDEGERLRYSVNVAESESDHGRLDREELLKRLPPGRSLIVSSPAELAAPRYGGAGPLPLLVPVGLVLLLLLMVESFFANRFYGLAPGRPAQL